MSAVTEIFTRRHSIVSAKPPEQPALPLAAGTPALANHQPRSLAMATIDQQRTAMETALGYLEAIENARQLGLVDASRLAAAKAHLLTALRRGK